MALTIDRISFLFCAIYVCTVCSADEMVMQIFPNIPINRVSDKFISFSMNPTELIEIYKNQRLFLLPN